MHAVLVWFDRLPYGLLACCGNTGTRTPGFDRLAAESVTFDRCFAADVSDDGSAGIAQLLVDLSQSGVAIRVVVEGNTYLGERLRTQREPGDSIDVSTCNVMNEDATAGCVNADDDVRDGSPQLTVLSLVGVPPDVTDWQSDRIATAVASADRIVARFAEQIGNCNDQQYPSLLIVTAAMGLTPETGARSSPRELLREQAIHVPLLGRIGPARKLGIRCNALVSTDDVATTLAVHLQRPLPESASRDLTASLTGDEVIPRDVIAIQGPDDTYGLRTNDWYLISSLSGGAAADVQKHAAESASLFMKPDDHWDQLDVASQSGPVVETLVSQLVAVRDADRTIDRSRS